MKNSNQQGFSSLSLMVLLPLLLSLLAGGAFIGRSLFEWNRQHHLCQKRVLTHQNELRSFLKQLLSLNPRAKSLMLQEKAAQAALVIATASGNPAAISAAGLRLKNIKASQLVLKTQQRIILSFAKNSAHRFNWNFRTDYYGVQKELHKSSLPYSYPLAVEPVPKSATAPMYRPVAHFSKKQNLGISIVWNIKNWEFLARVLIPAKAHERKLVISCGSTLKLENGKWYTHLSAAKPSLKL